MEKNYKFNGKIWCYFSHKNQWPYIPFRWNWRAAFFEKFKITTKIISGTIEIIELLYKSQNPLTNRFENSSVTFLNETTNFSIEKTISVLKTGKLIKN